MTTPNTSYVFSAPDTSKTVLELLQQAGLRLAAPCGGNRTCGKCIVKLAGDLSPVTDTERRMLTDTQIADGYRLACCTYPTGDFTAFLSPDPAADILLDGADGLPSYRLSPLVGDYGIAVDLGTTTVAVYLVDLRCGRIAGRTAFRNPQQVYGADVLSRIRSGHFSEQRSALIREINRAIASFGIGRTKLHHACIGGNTVMTHLFRGIDPSPLAAAPFSCPSLFGESVTDSGLELAEGAETYLMPCFSAYVGGDIAAGIVLTGMECEEEKQLFLDLGTNGETALGSRDGILLCSTAAGPSFEGAGISCGMPAIKGAVSHVSADGSFTVIGGGEPLGLCGSGILDLTAYLLRRGILTAEGFLEKPFFLTERIAITPQDIRQIQLAKAAIRAGIDTLMHYDTSSQKIARVLLAGGFSRLDPTSACVIGMLPPELEEKVVPVGNTAGNGCAAYLLSEEIRQRVGSIRSHCKTVELSADPFFMERFVDTMYFGEAGPEEDGNEKVN